MLVINRIAKPGGVKKVELRVATVRVVLRDGTEMLYINRDNEQRVSGEREAANEREVNQADYGALDAAADRKEP